MTFLAAMLMRKRFILIIAISIPLAIQAQNESLDSIINSKLHALHMPGLAACTIYNGMITWSGYYGYQNIEQKIPVTKSTLFLIASVGKTINASAISQLLAKGKLKLDDDVNKFLPFRVRNPYFPNTPITIGELLRHRSSIIDNLEYLQPIWDTTKGDPRIPLDVFLKDYLVEGGKHYSKEKNFLPNPPNAQRSYSNTGFALLGYVVQRLSNESYDQYCKKNIFEPLEMNSTAFFLKDIDTSQLATPYHYSDSLGRFLAYAQGGYPDYPAGLIRTSAEQLAHFLICWSSNGRWHNKNIFDSSTIQLFTPTDMHVGCYTWNIYPAPKKERPNLVYGHTGGDNGAFTFMIYQPDEKKGLILLFNGDFIRSGDGKNMFDLVSTLYESIR